MDRILRHSPSDAILVLLSVVHLGVVFAFPAIPTIALGVWWNSNTISHNFIHLPFFRANALNRMYSVYLSGLLGIPQELWRSRHLAHHAGRPWIFRVTAAAALEVLAVFAVWLTLERFAPRFFWFVYLPGYAVGLALCYLHGQLEHAGGTSSHYGLLYNRAFFNDGYHVEHHRRPLLHWTHLPESPESPGNRGRESRWPAVLRWIELLNLQTLEHVALRLRPLQRLLLATHESALRAHLAALPPVRTVTVIGGGMFPRTALLLAKLLPDAEVTLVDARQDHLDIAARFLDGRTRMEHRRFSPEDRDPADLLIVPLSFDGDRGRLYRDPPAAAVLVHDWIWRRRGRSLVVSTILLKRMNLVIR